jgi:hypothetical protein
MGMEIELYSIPVTIVLHDISRNNRNTRVEGYQQGIQGEVIQFRV